MNEKKYELNGVRVEITPNEQEIKITKQNGEELVLTRKIDNVLPFDTYCINLDEEYKKELLKILVSAGWFIFETRTPYEANLKETEVVVMQGFRFRREFLDFNHSNQEVVKAVWESCLTLDQEEFNLLFLDVVDYYLLVLEKAKKIPFQLSKTKFIEVRMYEEIKQFPVCYAQMTMALHKFLSKAHRDYGYLYKHEQKIRERLKGM